MDPQKQEFMELLNSYLERKGASISIDDILFTPPQLLGSAIQNVYNRNSRVRLINAKDENDKCMVYYNRLDVEILFGAHRVPINLDFLDVPTAVEKLNETYGTSITMDDIKFFEMVNGQEARIIIGESIKYLEDSSITIYPETELTELEAMADRLYNQVNFVLPGLAEQLGVKVNDG